MEKTIYRLISDHARQTPDAAALLSPDRPPLTYARFFQHLESVGRTLNSLGIGRNDRVAIVLPNGPEMAAAFAAVASYATSAPLNPAYGTAEFEFYLSDLHARAVIIQAGMDSPVRTVAQTLQIPVIELSPRPDAAGFFTLTGPHIGETDRPGPAAPDDIALVLHTSGTTSRPKIVPLTHANLCCSAHNIRQTLRLTPADRCLNVMPLFHIHGLIGATLSSLAAGASIVCTPGFNPAWFFDWVEAFTPTWYSAVPTIHQAILSEAARRPDVAARTSFRFIRSSSASLPPSVMAQLEQTFHAPVIESYGMTEASHQMASNPLPPGQRKPGSVGLPAGPEVAIMDEKGNLLPHGQVGEIVIRGPNVTRGYENNPTANQAAFSNGWFRTGDQGYFDQDGYLFLSGRIKELINRGGEKIAPREIDEVLLEHPAVAQAVAFAAPHPTLGEDVLAAVVLKPGATTSEEELRRLAFDRLADFKVPSRIIFLEQIPKGPTGKLQRIGLAEKLAHHLRIGYVAPRSDIEQILANLWADVLNLERVGVEDNFFFLGGDSLKALQLIARLRNALQVDLQPGIIFRHPTIAQQAPVIEAKLLDEIESLSDEEAARMTELQ